MEKRGRGKENIHREKNEGGKENVERYGVCRKHKGVHIENLGRWLLRRREGENEDKLGKTKGWWESKMYWDGKTEAEGGKTIV